MKERIRLIMEKAKMSQQDFANKLGISPASLSSIFTGRTNPTNNHVQAIHRAFPNININWLMFGEGNMCEDSAGDGTNEATVDQPASDGTEAADTLSHSAAGALPGFFDVGEMARPATIPYRRSSATGHDQTAYTHAEENVKIIDRPQRRVKEIRVFFDDGTYEAFVPSSK